MSHPHPIPSFHRFPDPQHFENMERLEDDITQLAAHINAATFQLLELIGIYDEHEGWGQHGLASCAHWLQWKCGTNLGTGREKVRVARALPDLPQISGAFREGRISYSKVRAMTRVATRKNEDILLNIALHGTAVHVERMVRIYRRHQRVELLQQENRRHEARELSCYMDDDGCWVFKGRFAPELGVLIKQALDKAADQQFREYDAESEQALWEDRRWKTRVREHNRQVRLGKQPCTAPGKEHPWEPTMKEPDSVGARRADALERIAESFLAGGQGEHSGGDRYRVNIHTEVEVLKQDGEGLASECEDCHNVPAETSRRMSCDASVVQWQESPVGEPLNIGRASRTIPPAIRRALKRRDTGCRFPGCSCTKFVDAHHIRHWADGGETALSNLVLLCRRHHRLVHEGGFGVHKKPDGEIWFSYPSKEVLPANADGRSRGNAVVIEVNNRSNGLDITANTLLPLWYGDPMDYSLIQWGLESRE